MDAAMDTRSIVDISRGTGRKRIHTMNQPRTSDRAHEKALIDACKRGDQASWEQLYVSYRPDVARALYRVVGKCDELQDLVQTVFVRVLKGLAGFECRAKLSTWLCAISTNVAMEYIRKAKKNRVVFDEAAPLRLVDSSPSPARKAIESHEMEMLKKALMKLSEKKRKVLLMHDLMQVPAEEIAGILKIPHATVRTRLFHARKETARRFARMEKASLENKGGGLS